MRVVSVGFSVSLFLSLSLCQSAFADSYLIDPTGGTPLAFTDADNGVRPVARPLGFTFNFFNESLTGVHPAVNGELAWSGNQGSTTGNGNPDTGGLPLGAVRRIAPFWDDLIVNSNGSVVERRVNSGSSVFYSVTWSVHKLGQTNAVAPTMNFQTVLFGGAQTVRGFSFQADDIAFSYNSLQSPQGGSATAGLQEGTGANRESVPPTSTGASASGLYSSVGSIPLHPSTDQFILFRRNAGDGSYNVSIQTIVAIPEPGSLALFALVGLPLVTRLRNRKN